MWIRTSVMTIKQLILNLIPNIQTCTRSLTSPLATKKSTKLTCTQLTSHVALTIICRWFWGSRQLWPPAKPTKTSRTKLKWWRARINNSTETPPTRITWMLSTGPPWKLIKQHSDAESKRWSKLRYSQSLNLCRVIDQARLLTYRNATRKWKKIRNNSQVMQLLRNLLHLIFKRSLVASMFVIMKCQQPQVLQQWQTIK